MYFDMMEPKGFWADQENKDWLQYVVSAAVKEYFEYWTSEPSLHQESGLSRYRPKGAGIPIETEPGHFDVFLEPIARKYGMDVNKLIDRINEGKIKDPEVEEYMLHDRAIRESGHDTVSLPCSKIDGTTVDFCADSPTALIVDAPTWRPLISTRCCTRYVAPRSGPASKELIPERQYEVEIAKMIDASFGGKFALHSAFAVEKWVDAASSSSWWIDQSKKRQEIMSKTMWNQKEGFFFDVDLRTGEQTGYEAVTSLFPLWAGLATEEQAKVLMSVSCHQVCERKPSLR